MTWFTFWLNYQIGGREPLLWHAMNIALHAACCGGSVSLVTAGDSGCGAVAALIFAVHPVQAEAVDYVYARAVVLCTLFSLLAIDRWIRDQVWMGVGWFALAVLAKEECVTVPLVLVLYSVWRGDVRRRILPLAAMLAISAAAGVRVMAAIQVTGMKNIGVNAGISTLGYLSEQGIAILRYLGLLVFPCFFTVDAQIPSPAWVWRVLAWLILLALMAAATFRLREVKAAFWILAGLILLIPSSSVFAAADLSADRRMYLPMLAFAPAAALLLPFRRGRWAMVVVGVLAVLSMGRTYVWSSDERLWGEAVRLAPEKVRPRIQLARAVGAEPAAGILEEAARWYPQSAEVATELARVYLELHRNGEALAQAGRALALTPGDPHALNNRGAVLLAMGQTAAARRDFVEALRRDACLGEARENLQRSGGVPDGVGECGRRE